MPHLIFLGVELLYLITFLLSQYGVISKGANSLIGPGRTDFVKNKQQQQQNLLWCCGAWPTANAIIFPKY